MSCGCPRGTRTSPLSNLPQTQALYRVILSLLEDQARPVFGRLDVLFEVGVVYLVPYAHGEVGGFLDGEFRETMEVGGAIPKRLFPKAQEALQVPLLDVALPGVDVDGEVDVVGDEDHVAARRLRQTGFQHVEALHDEDVGPSYGLSFVGQDVVGQVRVDRGARFAAAGFDVGQET